MKEFGILNINIMECKISMKLFEIYKLLSLMKYL